MRANLDSKWLGVVSMTLRNLRGACKSVVKYVSPTLVVKATWWRPPQAANRQETMLVTYGNPNVVERRDIKLLKKAGEPFPVKKLKYIPYPKKRRK